MVNDNDAQESSQSVNKNVSVKRFNAIRIRYDRAEDREYRQPPICAAQKILRFYKIFCFVPRLLSCAKVCGRLVK